MRRSTRIQWLAALIAAAIFAVGVSIIAAEGLRRSLSVTVYLIINLIVFLDLFDLLLRIYYQRRSSPSAKETSIKLDVGQFTPAQQELHLKPYAIVASLYNAEEILDDFLETMAPFRDRLFIIDDCSTDQTYLRLRRAHVNCIRGDRNRKKPGAIQQLVRTLPREIQTVVVVDPDAHIQAPPDSNARAELEFTLFEFQRTGMAAVCPRLVIREDGWLARLQELEYALAFAVGRRSLGDQTVTSGIAMYRRDALESALERHSLSVYAEDFRNALLMLGQGERIYYDGRLLVETEGKRKLSPWFSQRVGWFYGLIKVYTENFTDVLRSARRGPFFTYHYLLYIGVFTLLFHPLKMLALLLGTLSILNAFDNLLAFGLIPDAAATDPLYFLMAYLKYTLLIIGVTLFTLNGKERARAIATAPVFYFYSLFHLIPITVGYMNWLAVAFLGRRVYSDHFQDEESVRKESTETI